MHLFLELFQRKLHLNLFVSALRDVSHILLSARRPTSLSSAAEAGVLETHSLYTYTSPSLSGRGWCLISSTSKFVRLVGLEPTTPWLVDYPRFELAWAFPIVRCDDLISLPDIKSRALAIWAMDAFLICGPGFCRQISSSFSGKRFYWVSFWSI